jgi:hypothetical protein
MALDFVLFILLVSLLITRHSWQPQSAQGVHLKASGHAQAVVALISHDGAPGFRAEDAVEFSLVITLSG